MANIYELPSRYIPPPSTPEAVIKRVMKVIAEQYGVEESRVTPECVMQKDFQGDSLDRVELIMALEDEFGIDVHDEDAIKVNTAQDAVDLVNSHSHHD